MEFVRNRDLLNRLVLADGLPRSGKSMLSNILTGYDYMEKIQYYEFIEYISLGYHHQKISHDMAKTILRTQMDAALFDQMIGRNINTRPDDYSGLNNYHTPKKYIDRQDLITSPNPEFHGNPHGSAIAERVKIENPVCLTFTHNVLSRSSIIFDSFDKKVSFIYLNRRPIDLIYEWHRKDFGVKLGSDPTDITYWIKKGNRSLPIFTKGWEDEYDTMLPIDRVIKMILNCFKENFEGYEKSVNKNQIKIINFEELVKNPIEITESISHFLNLSILPQMTRILKQENCPRKLEEKEYNDRQNTIRENCSKKYLHDLDELEDIHSRLVDYSR